MKFGCCVGTTVEKIKVLKELGYDYAELSVNSFATFDEERFNEFYAEVMKLGFPCEAACGFVPGDIRLMGEEADGVRIKDYIRLALKRSYLLGIKTIVFGSGGARRVPDGMTREEGVSHIVAFLRDIVSPEAAKYGIMIAIEPLRPAECNVINTVPQGMEIAKATGCDNIKTLGDIHHMLSSGEDVTSIAQYKGDIIHVHTSFPLSGKEKRRYPRMTDTPELDQFDFINAAYLAGCPRCSIEAGCGDVTYMEEAGEGLKVLKDAYERALKAN